MRTNLTALPEIAVAGLLFLCACSPVTSARPSPGEPAPPGLAVQPKVLYLNLGFGDVPTLDPAIASDALSLQIIEQAFIGLTHVDMVTSETKPGIASSWEAADNPDGTQTITFHLRQDVPWVRWNGTQVETVRTCDGAADRIVTAHDFAYGIERNLNPATGSPYAYVWGFVLAGADQYSTGATDDFSTVGVTVVDDFTITLTFLEPASYNLQIAGMWIGRPQPGWQIEGDCEGALEARGERWTEPGSFQSYGPYTMSEWTHDSEIVLVKNPFWPGSGAVQVAEIDEIHFSMLDSSAAFLEYEAGNLDVAPVPGAELARVKSDPALTGQLERAPSLCSSFYGFNTTAEHVSDVRVRRALSMAIDRESLIENVLHTGSEPARWFGRPGLAAAPTMETYPELGIGFDPAAARLELQSYLDDVSLTAADLHLMLMFWTSQRNKQTAESIQQMWTDELGLNVQLASQEWAVYLDTLNGLGTPEIWAMGWCADYPDENNFLRDVFASGAASNPTDSTGKPSGGVMWRDEAFERLVAQAAVESNPAKRLELYAQAEEILVDTDAVIIPLTWESLTRVTKPYVRAVFGASGVDPLFRWDILPH